MTSRKERAAATRARIIDSAHELFAAVGYNGTTMKAVAEHAGVAVQTVYFVFHTKAELLSATAEAVAAGRSAPAPVRERAWFQEATTTDDGRRSLALAVENGVDIYSRAAPLSHAIREAALVDAEVDVMWSRIQVNRKAAMRRQVERIAELGQLRDGLGVDAATDVMHALVSHETYLELVQRSGWDLGAYKAWLYRSVCRLLLRDDLPSEPATDPLDGLTFAPLVAD
jgi:AcrR family transcriptional regulator